MPQVTPLVEIGFPSKEFLDVDFIVGTLDEGDAHVAYPNRVKVHQQKASGGHIALATFEGDDPWVILCDEIEAQGARSLPSPRYPAGAGIHATLYLAGVDPEALSVASIFPVTGSKGVFNRPQAPFTRMPNEVVRHEGYTHRFDVATPLLGRTTIFATKVKIMPTRELKY